MTDIKLMNKVMHVYINLNMFAGNILYENFTKENYPAPQILQTSPFELHNTTRSRLVQGIRPV